MRDLEERLTALAEEGDPRGAAHVMRDARGALEAPPDETPLPRWRGGLRAAVALVSVLAVVAIGATLVAVMSDDQKSATDPTDAPRYFLPATVPAGFTLTRTADGVELPRPAIDTTTHTQRWVQFDPNGVQPIDTIDVQWQRVPPTSTATGGDPLESFRAGSRPASVRGHDGLYSAQDGWLVWVEEPGVVVSVSAKAVPAWGQNAPALPRTIVDQVAASLRRRADGGFDITAPGGYELVGEWPEVGVPGVRPRGALYTNHDGRAFQLQLVDDSEQPPGSNPMFTSTSRVDVNGAKAWLMTFVSAPPTVVVDGASLFDNGDRFLQWTDKNTRLTVTGRGLADDQLVSIARSLAPVDSQTWRSHYRPPNFGTTYPSETSPPTTLSPQTTAPPPPGAIHYKGTFQGIEHYTLQTERCPQLDHNLTETFRLDDGTTWSLVQLYCGTITDTNLWTGDGTFLFTVPGGTFGGDIHTSARVYTSGGPDPITISRGTGRYAGVTGSCLLDEHIRQVTFGVQDHSGTFDCALSLRPGAAP
jgi:hypothetical protein